MGNLYESYKNLDDSKWNYYGSNVIKNTMPMLSNEESREFIELYFACGKKVEAFNVAFIDNYKRSEKHIHTVYLFFLGCYLAPLIEKKLESFLSKYIDDMNWYKFCYTWFLTSLFHDTSSCIEEDKGDNAKISELKCYLSKNEVKYNLYDHDWDDKCMKYYTYTEKLIEKYFQYRKGYYQKESSSRTDHGIVSGYLLYDKLIKNYKNAWDKHRKVTTMELMMAL